MRGEDRPADAAVHQVGRLGIRLARSQSRLSDGDGAGIAIWHMAWSDKDDAIDWQAYFHLRNRLVVASIHHDGPIGGILQSMAKATAKHLLCLEYSTVAIQNEAIRDFLAGPDHIQPAAHRAAQGGGDAQGVPRRRRAAVGAGPAAHRRRGHPSRSQRTEEPDRQGEGPGRAVRNNLRPADPRHHEVPQANYPPIEARWFSLGRVDGVTVTTADGRGGLPAA